MDINKILTSTPVNKIADIVTSPGFQHPLDERDLRYHWEVCPLLCRRPSEKNRLDLTGRRQGQLVVVGVLAEYIKERGKRNGKTKTRWVVRCDCGHYEARKSKSIRDPQNNEDRCALCQHVLYLRNGRRIGTREMRAIKECKKKLKPWEYHYNLFRDEHVIRIFRDPPWSGYTKVAFHRQSKEEAYNAAANWAETEAT